MPIKWGSGFINISGLCLQRPGAAAPHTAKLAGSLLLEVLLQYKGGAQHAWHTRKRAGKLEHSRFTTRTQRSNHRGVPLPAASQRSGAFCICLLTWLSLGFGLMVAAPSCQLAGHTCGEGDGGGSAEQGGNTCCQL